VIEARTYGELRMQEDREFQKMVEMRSFSEAE
jgi:hypothetical protein